MRKSPLKIEVMENEVVFASMEPSEFMAYMQRPNRFLSDLIRDFNQMKEQAGESVRVRSVLA